MSSSFFVVSATFSTFGDEAAGDDELMTGAVLATIGVVPADTGAVFATMGVAPAGTGEVFATMGAGLVVVGTGAVFATPAMGAVRLIEDKRPSMSTPSFFSSDSGMEAGGSAI